MIVPRALTTDLLNSLSSEFGDSFYLLDSDVFEQNYIDLTTSFKNYYKKFNIAYSYKTNYTPKLAKIVNELGGYAEVVSDMEVEIALRSGVASDRIIWNGPVKNERRVEQLLLDGGCVNIDSLIELDSIARIAEKHQDKEINIGVRCNYDVGDGVLSRFGIDVDGDDFDAAFSTIKKISNLHFIGLQAHFAKRNPNYWTARAEGMLQIYDRIIKDYGLKPERLDIGGGIYGRMPQVLEKQLGINQIDYNDYSSKAAKLFAEHFSNEADSPTMIIEPGSALAGNCMRFVSKVKSFKTIRGKTIITIYGSQKNISMSGINPPITVIPGGNQQKDFENADIVGYTCIEGDVLQKNYTGKLAIGDYLAIDNCGSYSLVMKPPFIFPNCTVLDISGVKTEIIKRAETFDDLFRTFCF